MLTLSSVAYGFIAFAMIGAALAIWRGVPSKRSNLTEEAIGRIVGYLTWTGNMTTDRKSAMGGGSSSSPAVYVIYYEYQPSGAAEPILATAHVYREPFDRAGLDVGSEVPVRYNPSQPRLSLPRVEGVHI